MTQMSPVKTVLKTALLAAAVASLAACASTSPDQGPSKTARTETEQWMDRVKVSSAPDEIILAPHAAGLSANQGADLEALFSIALCSSSPSLPFLRPPALFLLCGGTACMPAR